MTLRMATRRSTSQLTDFGAEPFMPLFQLAAHPGEEVMCVHADAFEFDPECARLLSNDDAAGRTQRVLVRGCRRTGPDLCHQLISVIIPEPVRHGRHEFPFEFRDIDCLWQGHRQARHVRDATSLRGWAIRTGAIVCELGSGGPSA